MVDSGYRVSGGYEDFDTKYRAMVGAALLRPAQAEISAWYERTDNDIDVTVSVTNRTGVDWTPDHYATVTILAYENTRALQTSRIVRAGSPRWIQNLADGATGTYLISLVRVPMVSWDRGYVVALVDYRPDPSKTPFDMVQAAIAVHAPPPTATPTVTPTASRTPSPTARPFPTFTPRPTSTPGGAPIDAYVFLPVAFHKH
jgi:hypothetical protein